MTRSEWFDPRDEAVYEFDVPAPEMWESENPVVGTILGPGGEVLSELRERPPVRFGYAPRG